MTFRRPQKTHRPRIVGRQLFGQCHNMACRTRLCPYRRMPFFQYEDAQGNRLGDPGYVGDMIRPSCPECWRFWERKR